MQLPADAISNWLSQNSEENKMIGRKQQERYLTIQCKSVQNTQELCDHLKKVNFSVKYLPHIRSFTNFKEICTRFLHSLQKLNLLWNS